MMGKLSEVQRYFEGLTGQPVRVVPLPETERNKLPLYLTGLYDLQTAELFGRDWILAVRYTVPEEPPAPGELARQSEQLRSALGKPVILVLAGLTPYLRRQLMRQGVPFAAPGNQIFLPMVWIDLRERYPRGPMARPEALTPMAQVVVLYHLQKASVEGQSLRELARKLGYSAMTLSKVADELAAAELCEVETKSRNRMLRFHGSGRELWERARPHLGTPMRAVRWVTWNRRPSKARAAGMTALASLSMIADDPLPVFALRDRDYRRLLETGRITGCQGPEEAVARVECWSYDPALLGNADRVDPLSLILSLADSPDERVQKALHDVEAGIW